MKSKKIIIIGGGGHAKVLIDAILSFGQYRIAGILDERIQKGERILGFPVIGTDELLCRLKNVCLAIGIGTVKASNKRKIIYDKYNRRGFKFPAIIHGKAYVSKGVKLGDGAQLMAGAIVNPGAWIGENTIINTAAIVEHDCMIAAHCHISVNTVLGGRVSVGESSHIGLGARVLQGIKIGSKVTVGAGAVVTKDVRDGKTVIGVPARELNE
mgnify:CR=1 FL=1